MRPLRIELEGFLSYREPTVIEFDGLPAAAIVGENGAGKTSIVEAIGWAMFGKGRGRPDEVVSQGATESRVRLTFQLGETVYQVERQRSLTSGGKSYLGLFRSRLPAYLGQDLEAIGGSTIAETQEAVERLIGLDHETWQATSFIGQGKADQFTALRAGERKQLLAEVLQLGRWQVWCDRAKDRERALAADAAAEQRRAEDLEDFITGEDSAEQRVSRAEAEDRFTAAHAGDAQLALGKAQEALQTARERASRVTSLRERVDLVRQGRERDRARTAEDLHRVEEETARLEREVQELEAEQERCRQAEALATELEAEAVTSRLDAEAREADVEGKTRAAEGFAAQATIALERANRHQEVLRTAEERITALTRSGGPTTSCFACGQPLSPSHRDQLLAQLQAESADAKEQVGAQSVEADKCGKEAARLRHESARLADEAKAARGRVGEAERAAERARADGDRVPQVAARRSECSARLSALKERAEHLVGQSEELAVPSAEEERLAAEIREVGVPEGELERRAADVRRLEEDLRQARQRATETAAELARAQEALVRYTDARKALETARARHEELAVERFRWSVLVEAFGRNGIPALIVENAVPQIEAEANRMLEALFPGLAVTLESQRATKAGDIRETLDVVVLAAGDARPLESFSGGERQAVDLALRIALARVMAHRAGRPIETLVVDEGFTAFDHGRRQEAVRVLHALVEEFPTLLFVTHDTELADAFPARIHVRREDGSSRVEIVGSVGVAA